MQKRTHKLSTLTNVAEVVEAAPSLSAAAKQLGVDRSSLYRWLKAGKIQAERPPRATSRSRQVDEMRPVIERHERAIRAIAELLGFADANELVRFSEESTADDLDRMADPRGTH